MVHKLDMVLYGTGTIPDNYQPFEATRRVTQGDIISPTIFNLVVDAIVRHW